MNHPLRIAPVPLSRVGQPTGASLVVTLLVISILTIIVIAFLQSMQVERATSRSYSAIFSAELAADAALSQATHLIERTAPVRNHYLVGSKRPAADAGPFLLLGNNTLSRSRDILPLVSGNMSTFLSARGTDNSESSINSFLQGILSNTPENVVDFNNAPGSFREWIDPLNPDWRYPAEWETLENEDNQVVARYAFFVIDEQGKLNLARHRGDLADDRNERDTTGIAEPQFNVLDGYPLDGSDFTVAGPVASDLPSTGFLTSGELQTLIDNDLMTEVGTPTFTEASSSPERSRILRSLYTAVNDTEPDVIPAGYTNLSAPENLTYYGPPNAVSVPANRIGGLPKWNINRLAVDTAFGATSAQRTTGLFQIMNGNLPLFRSRDVSFGSSGSPRYVFRLAASIVDYIDNDDLTTSIPINASVQEPAGQELQGVVSAIMERWIYTGSSATSVNVQHEVYVELWNPYTAPATGNFGIKVTTRRPVRGIPGSIDRPLLPIEGSVDVTVFPNERRVYRVAAETRSLPRGALSPEPYMDGTSSNDNQSLHSTFTSTWNGQLANWTPNDNPDFPNAGPGLQKSQTGTSSSGMAINTTYWSHNLPQHNLLPRGYRSVADPRQNYSMMYVWLNRNPATNSDVRINGIGNFSITGNGVGQDISRMWIGRDYVTEPGNQGVNFTQSPETAASTYSQSSHAPRAPGYIRNNAMRSIVEFGNIYDPASVTERGLSGQGGQPSPGSYFINGGGRTLRIGQAERSFFNQSISTSDRKAPDWGTPGRSVHHLLDLFTVAEIPTGQTLPQIPLRINLNTARREVLAGIFLGLGSRLDPIYNESNITLDGAFAIADEIIAQRPYNNFADFERFLNQLVKPTNFDPPLGPTTFSYPAHFNPNDFTAGATGPNEVSTAKVLDRAREEVFRRVFDNLGVTSRYLRVFVIGQALQPQNGRVLSQRLEEVLLRLDVVEDPADVFKLKSTIVHRRTP